MRYDFIELNMDEIVKNLPDMKGKVLAYAIEGMEERRLAVAVFIPAILEPKQMILYYIFLDPEIEGNEFLVDRFFLSCFRRLKAAGYRSIYYRSMGEIEDLIHRNEILTRVGFEPRVFIGEMQGYRLGDLLVSDFMVEFPESAAAELKVTKIHEGSSREERSFLNKMAQNDPTLQNAIYSPGYSFFYSGEEGGGVLGMLYDDGMLTMTAIDVDVSSKRNRKLILKALLGRLLEACRDTIPEDTQIQLFYDERYDHYMTKKIFESKGVSVQFQEFIRPL